MEIKSQLIGVLPCAGLGTRVSSFTQAKELEVIEGKPNLQHWIETMFDPETKDNLKTIIILSSIHDTHYRRHLAYFEIFNSMGFKKTEFTGSYQGVLPAYLHVCRELRYMRYVGMENTEYAGKEILLTLHTHQSPHPNPIVSIDTMISAFHPENKYSHMSSVRKPSFLIAFPDIFISGIGRKHLARDIGNYSIHNKRHNYVSVFSKHLALTCSKIVAPVKEENFGHIIVDSDDNVVDMIARYTVLEKRNSEGGVELYSVPRREFPKVSWLDLGIYIVTLDTLHTKGTWLYDRMDRSELETKPLHILGDHFQDLGDPAFYLGLRDMKGA